MIRRPPRSTPLYSSAASDVYKRQVQIPSAGPSVSPESLFSAMEALARASEAYRGSGGIHSAGAWDGERLLLFAEDIGRHNTIDRIAGQALLAGIDLSGRILVASGLSLIHISEPTRLRRISYAVFCLKK